MKKVILFLSAIIFSFVAHSQHTSKWKVATKNIYNNSLQIPELSYGDTLAVDGNLSPYSYSSMNGVNGLTIVNINSQVYMTNGFEFINCHNIHLTGTGINGLEYGFKIVYSGDGGTAITFKSNASWIEVDHIETYRGLSAFWLKDEQSCNSSINYPNGFFHVNIHHNKFIRCASYGDMMYCGSTDPYGISRSITCNGVVTHPRPARLGWIRITDNIIDSSGRQAIQVNNCDTGGTYIANNIITRSGWGREGNQGNAIFIGQGTANDTVISNHIDETWQHGIWSYGYKSNYIVGNYINHSGIIGSYTNYAESPIQISGPYNTSKAWFYFANNYTSGVSSDPQHFGLAIDNQGGNLQNTNNFYCDVAPVYNPQKVVYSSSCEAVPENDTIWTTIHDYKHDTLQVSTIPQKIIFIKDTLVESNNVVVKTVTRAKTMSIWTRSDYVKQSLYDTVPAHDTVIITTTPPHDTSYYIIKPRQSVGLGIFINDGIHNTVEEKALYARDTMHLEWIRYNHNFTQVNWLVPQYKSYGLKVQTTINIVPNQSDEPYPTDTSALRDSLTVRYSQGMPDFSAYLNEENNFGYYDSSVNQASDYSNALTAFINVCSEYGIECSNGGLLYKDLIYPMFRDYQDRGINDSLQWLKNVTGVQNITGQYQRTNIRRWDILKPVYSNPKLTYLSVHIYSPENVSGGDTAKYVLEPFWPVAIAWLKGQTGKDVVCNEYGTRNFSKSLFNDTSYMVYNNSKKFIIYYAGDNSALAINLSDYYKEFIMTNSIF